MNNIKKKSYDKIFRTVFIWLITLILFFGNNAPTFANPVSEPRRTDENNPGVQEFPPEIFEDFPTTDLGINAVNEEALTSAETLIDKERLHFFSLTMLQLENRERNIIVYLPPDYETGNNSYPVIYALDAQGLFIQASFSPEDRILNEALFHFYTQDFDGEAIIVGIESDPIHLWDEYSPWVNRNMYLWVDPYEANQVEGGEGDAFLDFMEQTLKPVIDERYRTLPDRENTSIAGSKMGGLLSIYAGLTRPEIYSNVMAMSPAVWFAESGGRWLSNNRLIKLIKQKGIPVNFKFFLDVAKEDRTTDLVIRPVVSNVNGDQITFSQAYLEGIQSVVNQLVWKGFSTSNLIGGLENPTEWTDKMIENPSAILGESAYLSYLPMIMEPDTTFEGCPDSNSCLITFSMDMSPYLNRTRNITVYLPPGYNSGTYYPVIYLLDEQHIFGAQTPSDTPITIDDSVDWTMDEKLDSYYSDYGRGVIAVGIWFDTDYPWSEYTITPNPNMDHWWSRESKLMDPEGGGMINFIRYVLKPEIDSRFNTLSDRDHTAIGGGSRCALLALYAGLLAPETFSRVMAMSPAVWIAESKYEDYVAYPELTTWRTCPKSTYCNGLEYWFKNNQAPTNVKYFLYIGTSEQSGYLEPFVKFANDPDNEKIRIEYAYVDGARMVKNALISDGVQSISYIENPGGTHYPSVWRNYIIPNVLPFFEW